MEQAKLLRSGFSACLLSLTVLCGQLETPHQARWLDADLKSRQDSITT